MNRNKRMPYGAGRLIDSAKMENADVIRELLPIITGQLTSEDILRRVATAIHHAHESTKRLSELPKVVEEE